MTKHTDSNDAQNRGIIAVRAAGTLAVERALEAMVDVGTVFRGELDVDDEETVLAVLGLPSEVVLP